MLLDFKGLPGPAEISPTLANEIEEFCYRSLSKSTGPIDTADGPDQRHHPSSGTRSIDLAHGYKLPARQILINFDTKIPQSHLQALVTFRSDQVDP